MEQRRSIKIAVILFVVTLGILGGFLAPHEVDGVPIAVSKAGVIAALSAPLASFVPAFFRLLVEVLVFLKMLPLLLFVLFAGVFYFSFNARGGFKSKLLSLMLPALQIFVSLLVVREMLSDGRISFHHIGIFLGTAMFIYLSFLAGNLLLRFIGAHSLPPMKRVIYAPILGYGVFGIFGLICGLLGIFNAFALWIFAFVIIIASVKTIAAHLRFINETIRTYAMARIKDALGGWLHENGFLKVVVVLWLVVNLWIAFVPVTGHDALDYHLPVMWNLIGTEKLVFSVGNLVHIPILTEIMYAVPTVMFNNSFDPFIFQILQYLTVLPLLGIVYLFLRDRIGHKFFAIATMVGILAISDFARELLHGGYVDVFVFLFGIASALLLIESFDGRKPPNAEFKISAIYLGLALSMKYLSFFFVAINAFFLLVFFVRHKMQGREIIKRLATYSVIVAMIAGIWYAKNAVLFGNPVYPMFSNEGFSSGIGWFALDRTIPNLFIFPFYRYGQWFIQDVESASRLVVLAFFIILYLVAVATLIFRRKQIRLPEVLLFSFIHLYLLFSFYLSHQYRFLLPATMLLPPLLALLFDRWYVAWKNTWSIPRYSAFIKGSLVLFNIITLLLFIGNLHYFHVKLLYKTGFYSQDEYIEEIGGQ